MVLVIFAILFGLVGLGLFFFGKRTFKTEYGKEATINLRPWSIIPFAIAGIMLFFASFTIVSVGNVGIPVTFGNTGSPLDPGMHFINPFANVHNMNLREQQYTMVHQGGEGNVSGDDSLGVLGSDGGSAQVDSTLLYKIDSAQASNLFKHVGTAYVTQIIRPAARSCITGQFTQYAIVDAATDDRAAIQTSIKNCLVEKLGPFGLNVDDFQLRQIALPTTTQSAVNAKIAANQNAEQKVFDLQAAQGDAQITTTKAKATSDSQQIVACGGHVESGINPQGQKIQVVIANDKAHCDQAQLTPAFLQYSYIQALLAMANSPNHSSIILPVQPGLTPNLLLPTS